jgi:hypothetical protein
MACDGPCRPWGEVQGEEARTGAAGTARALLRVGADGSCRQLCRRLPAAANKGRPAGRRGGRRRVAAASAGMRRLERWLCSRRSGKRACGRRRCVAGSAPYFSARARSFSVQERRSCCGRQQGSSRCCRARANGSSGTNSAESLPYRYRHALAHRARRPRRSAAPGAARPFRAPAAYSRTRRCAAHAPAKCP